MSKEVDTIRQAIELKRQEIDTVAKNKQLEKEKKAKEISDEIERRRQEILTNSSRNQKMFQDAGIIKLLEDIGNSGLLRYNLSDKNKPEYYFIDKPVYRSTFFSGQKFVGYQKEKVHCEPPHIEWSGQGLMHPVEKNLHLDLDLHDHSRVSLVFNYESWPSSGKYDESPGGSRCDSISFYIKENEIHIDDKKISEVPNMSNYLAEKISKTIN